LAGVRDAQIHVNAKSDNGLNPRGNFSVKLGATASLGPVTASGRVTCLDIVSGSGHGNNANVAGEITKTTDLSQAPVGTGFLMRFQDFGEPGSEGVSPDRARAIHFGFLLTTCPGDIGTAPIEQGNFVIHALTLLP
jgi:hypothetical protein